MMDYPKKKEFALQGVNSASFDETPFQKGFDVQEVDMMQQMLGSNIVENIPCISILIKPPTKCRTKNGKYPR